MGVPRATLAIVALLVVAQAVLSYGFLFQRPENIGTLGFSFAKPFNILVYNFVHVSYAHLLMNLVIVLAAGLTLEGLVGPRHVLSLFFVGSAVSAVLFSLYSSGFVVVGASAGAIAMLGAAFAVDTRKAFAFTVAALALGTVLVFAANYYVEFSQGSISRSISSLQEQRRVAIDSNNAGAVESAGAEIAVQEQSLERIRSGLELERSIPPSYEIHVFAAFFGVIYAFVFLGSALEGNARGLLRAAGSVGRLFGRG